MPLLDDPWLPAPDSNGNIPRVRAAPLVAVYRYDGASTLAPLPNVECLWIQKREGTDPGTARFRYNLASGVVGAPTSIETALGTGFGGAATVNPGDRLVVQALLPDGVAECLFDGIATDFGMGLDPDSEQVYLGAIGIAWHCWDAPIGGAIYRKAQDPLVVSDTQTGLPAHFNPDGQPNGIPDGAMAGTNAGGHDFRYPTFLDPLVVRSPDVRTQWTLPKAARYLLYTNNLAQTYVQNPDGAALDALLVAPNPLGSPLPIACPDLPITGKDWPGTLDRLAREAGFGMRFRLSTVAGLPVTTLDLFATQAAPVKSLYLAPRGTPFSPTTFNVASSTVHRDTQEVVNRWVVKGGADRWEGSYILAAGFPSAASDYTDANSLHQYDKAVDADRAAYRLYVFDETGEGHYAPGSAVASVSATALDAILGTGNFAGRRRKPIGRLLDLGPRSLPTEATLSISTNYAGPKPGIWDGTGTWQRVASSTWQLLSDRLGILITDQNPNVWEIGASKVAGVPYPSGIVHGVEARCGATGAVPFWLRLTCVIEADGGIGAVAGPTGNSPLSQTISRTVDASDRYRKDRIYGVSEFNAGATIVARDDTALAQAEANALVAATEAGVLEGPVTIPRLTTYYQVGDRIGSIDGRGLGLRTDAGTGTPVYPSVVGVRHDFGEDGQTTTLELSDAGADRRKYTRPARRVLRDSMGRPRFNRHGG